jgi:hypothetical protein
MKKMFGYKPYQVVLQAGLLLMLMLAAPFALADAGQGGNSPTDIVAKLKPKLSLSDQQASQLTTALTDLQQTLKTLIDERNNGADDEDPSQFIDGVKKAQKDYQDKLKTILSSSQQQSYNDLREKVIMEAMDDLATIKLYDFQPHVGFSDAQMQKLVPVLAKSMRDLIKIAWEYAGRHLRLLEKLHVAAELKGIQSKSEQQVQKILSTEQMQKWNAYKKQLQEQSK